LIAVQLHGEPCTEALDRLRRAGAQIIPIALYRWAPPSDIGAALKLINSICDAQLEAVTFTSAPAVVGLVELASHAGVQEQMIKMLKTKVLACCVGPVCAAPLERHGITALVPPRARLGHLIRLVSEAVPAYHSRVLKYNGGSLEIRGHGLMLDNTFISIPSAPLEVLKTLAQQPGRIITKAELMAALGIADPSSHAVEIAITRLRSYLPEPRLVQTVTKRGYRLATISRSGNEALEESP
jgi:uroporphyrinogen-III synthase